MRASKGTSLVQTPESGLSRSSTCLSTSSSSTFTNHKASRPLRTPLKLSSTSLDPLSDVASRPLPSIPNNNASLHLHLEASDEEATDPEPFYKPKSGQPQSPAGSCASRGSTDLSEAEGPQLLTEFPSPPRSTDSAGESILPSGHGTFDKRNSFASTLPTTPEESSFGPQSRAVSPQLLPPAGQKFDDPQPDGPPFGPFADPNAPVSSSCHTRSGSRSTHRSAQPQRPVKAPKRYASELGNKTTNVNKRMSASFLDVSDDDELDGFHPAQASDFGLHHFISGRQKTLVRTDTARYSAKRSVADVPEDTEDYQSIMSVPCSQYSSLVVPTYHVGSVILGSESLEESEACQESLCPAFSSMHNIPFEITPTPSASQNALPAKCAVERKAEALTFNPFHLSPEAYTKRENGHGKPAIRKAFSSIFQRRPGPFYRQSKTASESEDFGGDHHPPEPLESLRSPASSIHSSQISSVSSISSGYGLSLWKSQRSWKPTWSK